MPDLGSFRPEFEQIIVIFKISTFKFDNMSSFMLNKLSVWDQSCLM